MNEEITVHLVDDNSRLLRSMKCLLAAHGYSVEAFNSGQSFLSRFDSNKRGVVVLDIATSEMDGLTVQRALAERNSAVPIVFMSGKENVEVIVESMKAGAIDFLLKPVAAPDLLAAIARAIALESKAFYDRMNEFTAQRRVDTLTPREREVLVRVIAGNLNKEIAADLGTGEKTVKLHRGRMMRKLSVRSVADVVRLAQHAGIQPHRCKCGYDNRGWPDMLIQARDQQGEAPEVVFESIPGRFF